jgi:glycosyltransferase involved in cell wall biosynthesis
MEAMHAGVPIVASDIGPLRELLADSAVLVRPDDPGALAEAVVALAGDRDRRARLAAQGRARAAELFDARRMAAETLALYERIGAD